MASLTLETEHELLLAVACYSASDLPPERSEAEQAFMRLLERHQQTLNSYVGNGIKRYRTFRFEQLDLYNKLCLKIWLGAATFDPKSEDPKVIQDRFLGWANRILKNLINDEVRAVQSDLVYHDFDSLLALMPSLKEGREITLEDVTLACRALESLPERDQDILRALAEGTPLDGTQYRPDPESVQALAKRWDVTVPSLRTLRQRAIERFKQALESLASPQQPP
jgi:RNA polymerase sigma factor (sigma-70 family)